MHLISLRIASHRIASHRIASHAHISLTARCFVPFRLRSFWRRWRGQRRPSTPSSRAAPRSRPKTAKAEYVLLVRDTLHTHTLTHSHSRTHTHSLALTHTHSLTHALTRSHTLSLSHAHRQTDGRADIRAESRQLQTQLANRHTETHANTRTPASPSTRTAVTCAPNTCTCTCIYFTPTCSCVHHYTMRSHFLQLQGRTSDRLAD